MSRIETDVLVVGAGPAGLTAACLLTGALRDVVVVEREMQVGGIARTTDYKGFRIDLGGHRFTSRSREVETFWRDLLPGGFVETPLATRTWRAGGLHAHPRTAVEALKALGAGEAAAGLLSLAAAKLHPLHAPRNLEEWGRNAFGDRLFAALFRTRIEKACGTRCDALPAAEARGAIDDLEMGSEFWSTLADMAAVPGGQRSRGPAFRQPVAIMRYPRRGSGAVWSAAARKVIDQGGRILLGHGLQTIAFDAASGRWTATVTTADGAPTRIVARSVVASGPLPDLCAALKPTPISLFNARALRHRALVSVAFVTRRPGFADHWIDVNDPTLRAFRVRNMAAHAPEMVPHPGLGCLAVEYLCEEDDMLWRAVDGDLVALARRELLRMGLAAPQDVMDATVLREARACPIVDEEARHSLAMVRLDLERAFPTLHLVGRNGTHGGHRQEHAVISAMRAVDNLTAGERIHDTWNAAREEARWDDPPKASERVAA